MGLNEGDLEVGSLAEAVGKTVNGYQVISVDEEKKKMTLLVDGQEMTIDLVEFKHNQNIVIKYQGNHQIRIALSEDGLYKLGVDEYEMTLNGEMSVDELIKCLTTLDKMIEGLNKIKIKVFENTRMQTEIEAEMEEELLEQGNGLTKIVTKNIQKIRHKKISLIVLKDVTTRIEQLDEINTNLEETIALYGSEDNDIEPEIKETYIQFMEKLIKLREVVLLIRYSLNNKYNSVKNIMNLYGIKE